MLAEFGTEMVGVFNKDYIDEASSIGYKYTTQPGHGGPIAIGVDWDQSRLIALIGIFIGIN